jgi:hypothetical protein
MEFNKTDLPDFNSNLPSTPQTESRELAFYRVDDQFVQNHHLVLNLPEQGDYVILSFLKLGP